MASERSDFKGVNHIGNTRNMARLEINLKTWLDWAFLRIGGWFNVTGETLDAQGTDYNILRNVVDPNYTNGTVWESVRKDWCWETGVDYVNTLTYNPTSPAASITVDGNSETPDYIDYPLGRIVFSSAQSTTAVVKANYSYRWVQVYIARLTDWWLQLQHRSFRPDDGFFSNDSDGNWSMGGQHRVQMPAIILEAVPRTISRGYQLGDGAMWVEQDILCHILTENKNDRSNLMDILLRQFDSQIWLFDPDAVALASDYPLDYRGEIVDSAQTYPALVDESTGHRWGRMRIVNTSASDVESFHSKLYQGVVRLTCEVAIPD